MKKTVALLVAVSISVCALVAMSAADNTSAKPEVKSWTGEVVDTGCYLAHGARGAKHAECANKCISGGMPMGLLAEDGTLYLITLNHENPDAYNKLKKMASKTVTVSGTMSERSGIKGIDVTSVKLAAAAAK
jgi:hypothetical protein